MKKIITALLLASLILTPSLALAAPEDYPTEVPFDSDLPGSPQAQQDAQFKQIEALTKSGEVVGCQTGGFGGALAQTFGAALQQAIPGFLRSQLGGALNKLASQAGPFGQVIQAAGNIAINKLSTFLQNKIGELFGGSSIANTVSQITGGVGAGVGAGISAITGGAVPGVGAASVPVNETGSVKTNVEATRKITETKLAPDARRTAEATETSAQAKCVGDPLINKLKNAILSMLFKSTIDFVNSGFDGDTALIQNLRQFLFEGVQAVTEDFISNQLSGLCSTQRQPVQVLLLTQYQYETNFGARTQCAASNSALAQKRRGGGDWSLFAESAYDSTLSDFGIFYASYEELKRQSNAQTDSNLAKFVAQGPYKDGIKCNDGSNPVGGYCPGNSGKTNLPGDVIRNELLETLNQPRQQLLNADEIGELIDALTASVSQVALQGIDGLLGLSKKSGNQGSYLDQMVSEATGVASGDAQEAVTGDLEAALAVEEAYLETVSAVHGHLATTRGIYMQAVQCYKTKSTAGGANAALALTKLNNASSTVATVIDPQLKSLGVLMADSEDAIDALKVLIAESETALTPNDVISVNDRFVTLMQSGIVHTSTDLTYLENNYDTAAQTLDLLRTDANAMLTECQAL